MLTSGNPRGKEDGIGDRNPLAGEMQAVGSAGSVLIMDSRIWHSNAENPSDGRRLPLSLGMHRGG